MDIKNLMFEAYRRSKMKGNHGWVGLGTEAVYRPAIKAGLLEFHDGKTPPVRCMGWLVLTQEGLAFLREHESAFAKRLDEINNDPAYRRSVVANYELAGGLTKR